MHNVTKQLVNETKAGKAEKKESGKPSTREIVYIGMFAAILAILSQISIPMPSGMPITLQTFAVALTGFVLSWKRGTVSTLIFILLGAVGVPVFSGLRGGVQVLAGHTGGFIWGFVFMVMFCGIGIMQENKTLGIMISFIGLAICHLFGVIQFAVVMKMDFLKSFLLASAPYLIKDAVSVILAYILGYRIRKSLLKANLL
ncbi:MAG: biotin transporter BioY [Lachnospiraceae bacterium]|nr:biotin transporter BioY [Lachnospiraceae bacterium]